MPAPQWITTLPKLVSPPPLRTLVRSTTHRFNPPKPCVHLPGIDRRQRQVIGGAEAREDQLLEITCEKRLGQIPTIVVGGFVPGPQDATYLQRDLFLSHGSIYYFNFGFGGFSTALFEAQLDDLIEELNRSHGTPPVVFGVSFGGGLVLHWLRRHSTKRTPPAIAGILLVSPVGCTADLLEPGAAKASTLLGRLMKSFLETPADGCPEKLEAWVERSRQVMVKMFESGAQNKQALRAVLTKAEVHRIRHNVIESMRSISPLGARERTGALNDMPSIEWAAPESLPLHDAPALILYAEKESSIMVDRAPTRRMLERSIRRYFPQGAFAEVSNSDGSPVQHASLLFHCFCFEPHLKRFYRRLHKRLPGDRRIRHTLTRFMRPQKPNQRLRPAASVAALETSASVRILAG